MLSKIIRAIPIHRVQALAGKEFSPAFSNAFWLMCDQASAKLISAIAMILIARHLGPEEFGLLSVGLAIVVYCRESLSGLGMHGVVVREVVRQPDHAHEIMGTALVLRFLAGVVTFFLCLGGMRLTLGDEPAFAAAELVLAVSCLLVFTDNFHYYFIARLKSRFITVANVAAVVAGAASVVILISLDASLVAITAALTGQILLKSVLNTIVYQLAGAPLTRLRATLAWARSVLALGWPLALSSVAIGLYQRIDVVMLGELAGATETGLYNAAARLSDAGTFVGVAIATSAAPGLIHMHATNDPRYGASLVRFATILFYLGVSGALFVTLINEPLIRLLYGPKFAGSAAILQIHIWSAPFIFLGHLVMRWLIVERLMHFEITRTIVAALINISLNFVLIPLYGGIGAALATIASNLVSGYLVCFLFPSTRSAAMFITQGMVFPLTWSLARVSRALNRPRGPRETLPADD